MVLRLNRDANEFCKTASLLISPTEKISISKNHFLWKIFIWSLVAHMASHLDPIWGLHSIQLVKPVVWMVPPKPTPANIAYLPIRSNDIRRFQSITGQAKSISLRIISQLFFTSGQIMLPPFVILLQFDSAPKRFSTLWNYWIQFIPKPRYGSVASYRD